jgi:hypothetical protein
MHPSNLPAWSNFFAAELGAAATLTGLLFVAVSINLTRILQFSHLPSRAAESLLALVSVLFATSFALIPGQTSRACGIEIGAAGLVMWVSNTVSLVRLRRFEREYVWFVSRFLLNQVPPLPFVVCGILMILGSPSAVFWMVPGTLLSLGAGIFGAWVLLVEIQR